MNMKLYVDGYLPPPSAQDDLAKEKQLIFESLPLILKHESDILANSNYFFCTPSFAWCSVLYFAGDGPLSIGHLLKGWRDGMFTEPCSECGDKILLFCFGGSPLSGSSGWSGYCLTCVKQISGDGMAQGKFGDRGSFATALRRNFPLHKFEWEEYDGFKFSWGGNGLEPARKKRLVQTALAEPVSLEVLVRKLKE
jgi:hypothetical protein